MASLKFIFRIHLLNMTFLCWASTSFTQTLKKGDLLFVTMGETSLSNAINEVTQTEKQTNFTHVAIVDVDRNGHYWILHAGPRSGVERLAYQEFIDNAKQQNQSIAIYRIFDSIEVDYDQVIREASMHIGKPYNFTYILSDTAMYCSDYVWKAYKHASIFQLEPMTFINPKTKSFDEGWVKHYDSLKLSIPEGRLGCNPNQMAVNPALYFVDWID